MEEGYVEKLRSWLGYVGRTMSWEGYVEEVGRGVPVHVHFFH